MLSKILVAIFAFCLLFSTVSFSKTMNSMDSKNPSVQLLMQLNAQGEEVRKNDVPIIKPDTEADTKRVKELKEAFEIEKIQAFTKDVINPKN